MSAKRKKGSRRSSSGAQQKSTNKNNRKKKTSGRAPQRNRAAGTNSQRRSAGNRTSQRTASSRTTNRRSSGQSSSRSKTRSTKRPPKQPQVSRSREELRLERREKQAKKRRRKNRIRKIILVLILAAAALIVVGILCFKIETIKVLGVSQYTDSQIISACGVHKGDNLFLVRGSKIQESINAALPYSGKVRISRTLPHTLVLHVYDAEITTAIQEGTSYYLLDEDGTVLEHARTQQDMIQYLEEKNSRAPIQRDKTKSTSSTSSTTTSTTSGSVTSVTSSTSVTDASGNALNPEETDILNHVMVVTGLKIKSAQVGKKIQFKDQSGWELYQQIHTIMRSIGLRNITGLDLTSPVSIKMTYENRIRIIVGDSTQLENKLEICKSVLDKQDEISRQQSGQLDVSIPGKAYFYTGKLPETTTKKSTKAAAQTTTVTRRAATTPVPGATMRTTRAAVTGVNNQRMTSRSW